METIHVGMIGAGFMAKLHSIAFVNYPMYFWPPKANVKLSVISDKMVDLAKAGKERYGYESYESDWYDLVERDDIDLVDIVTPNFMHKEMVLKAIKNGKHVFCEKPLAVNAKDAKLMFKEAETAGVIHANGFNNRCIPAVRMAKQLIEEGFIGEIYSLRTQYMQDYAIDPDVPMEWRFDGDLAGSGALGDIGSHAIDLSRFLVGEIERVVASSRTIVKERPVAESSVLGGKKISSNKNLPTKRVTVDDAVEFITQFENGARGVFQASRFAYGHKNTLDFEIYGSKGALKFTNERLWELQYYNGSDPDNLQGYRTIKMGPQHPYGAAFWPIADLGIGYADLKCAEISHLIEAIEKGDKKAVSASFEDGYKAVAICDAVKESASKNEWVTMEY